MDFFYCVRDSSWWQATPEIRFNGVVEVTAFAQGALRHLMAIQCPWIDRPLFEKRSLPLHQHHLTSSHKNRSCDFQLQDNRNVNKSKIRPT